jgi:penicillin-binding protein 1A
MKENYADKELGVSDGEFPEPENMSINVDCAQVRENGRENQDRENDLDGLDF